MLRNIIFALLPALVGIAPRPGLAAESVHVWQKQEIALHAQAAYGNPYLDVDVCALRNLQIYLDGFITRNGFHVNGDFKGKGYVKERFRPFTIEGNFAAALTVHEMLLQSWGDTVRVFPAVPREWPDASFDNLRAEGAFAVSARREGGCTVSVTIKASQDGHLRLRDPFAGAKAVWNRRGVSRRGADYECSLARGQVLEGRFA